MRPRRQRAQRAVLRCWRRVVVFANLWGKAKVLKFFAPSHFGAFTQSSLVLKFFAARRRELRLRREARDRSQPSTDRDDEWHARPRGHRYDPPKAVRERQFLNNLTESEFHDLFQ